MLIYKKMILLIILNFVCDIYCDIFIFKLNTFIIIIMHALLMLNLTLSNTHEYTHHVANDDAFSIKLEGGGRKLNENKALTSKARCSPYTKYSKCRICRSSVHQAGSHYCQGCAYKKGYAIIM